MGSFVADVKNAWLASFITSTYYLALFVGDPTDGGVEISADDYARPAVAPAVWGTPAAGSVSNSEAAVTFSQSTSVWSASNVTHWAFFDAEDGGNMKTSDDLPANLQQPIVASNTVSFAVGSLVLSISDPA